MPTRTGWTNLWDLVTDNNRRLHVMAPYPKSNCRTSTSFFPQPPLSAAKLPSEQQKWRLVNLQPVDQKSPHLPCKSTHSHTSAWHLGIFAAERWMRRGGLQFCFVIVWRLERIRSHQLWDYRTLRNGGKEKGVVTVLAGRIGIRYNLKT